MPIDFRYINKSARPLYRGLAEELARQIRSGDLLPDERLPTQNELSKLLGIARNTICRAYQVLRTRRLITTEVGRGTFVRKPRGVFPLGQATEGKDESAINLAVDTGNVRGLKSGDRAVQHLLSRIESRSAGMYSQPTHGPALARVGSIWLRRHGIDCPQDRVLACVGHHHGILLSILACTSVGDRVAVDRFTYPGIRQIGEMLDRQIVHIDSDSQGTEPCSLERVCLTHRPKLVHLMPSVHNPSSIAMPASRREELGRILEKHRIPFLEDDGLRLLAERSPVPLVNRHPELGIYLAGFSRLVCCEPRLEFLAVPTALRERFNEASWATVSAIPCTSTMVAQALIESGMAEEAVIRMRSSVRDRISVAADFLGQHLDSKMPPSPHLWIDTVPGQDSETIAADALAAGVRILPAAPFFSGPENVKADDGIQICLIGPESLADLRSGLQIVARLLEPSLHRLEPSNLQPA